MPVSKTVNHRDTSPSSRARYSAKHYRGPSVHRESRFFQAKFCLAKEVLHILKPITVFIVSKRDSQNGTSLMPLACIKQTKTEAGFSEHIISCVKETCVAAPFYIVRWEMSTVRWKSHNVGDAASIIFPCSKLLPACHSRAHGFFKNSLDLCGILSFWCN